MADMAHRSRFRLPRDLRARLETARLELLALFRALDQLDLSAQEIPQELLRELFKLDADFAEALWTLDQPPHRLDLKAMLRDTLSSLEKLKAKRPEFLRKLARRAHLPLERQLTAVGATLTVDDAYLGVPGRDPEAPIPLIG